MKWLTIIIALLTLSPLADAAPIAEGVKGRGYQGDLIVIFSPYSSATTGTAAPPSRHQRRKERIAAGREAILRDGVISRGEVKRAFRNFPILHLAGSPLTVERLSRHPLVRWIGENRRFSPTLASSLPYIGVPTVQGDGHRGGGTAVVILDTGVDHTRSAFGSCSSPGVPAGCAVAASLDTAPDDGSLDDNGHGTNVAGIVLGVAPETKIVSIDVFSGGYAYDSDILEGLDWVMDNRESYGIAAVNMSLGDGAYYTSPCPTDPISPAVTTLKEAGVVTVIAAGNDAYVSGAFHPGISSPACVPDAVSVGAIYDSSVGSVNAGICTDTTTQAGKVACFSQAAPLLSLTAPGVFITAAGSTYSGTSQATPHVAGAVALLRSAHPLLSASRTVEALTTNVPTVTDKRFTPNRTFPRLDIPTAINNFPRIAPSTLQLDFGEVPTGLVPSPRILTLGNVGSRPLTISGVSVPAGSTAGFSLGQESCSGGSIPPGGGCSITIEHHPITGGIRSTPLQIDSDDPDSPRLTVILTSHDTPLRTLSLTLSGTGSGSVTSTPPGISCPPTCSAPFPSGASVTLTPLPDLSSFLSLWSAEGCTLPSPCTVTLDTDRNAGVSFTLKPVSTPSGGWYLSLTDALWGVAAGETIRLVEGEMTGNVTMARDIPIRLQGGYDPTFATQRSATAIRGEMVIEAGSVEMDSITLF
ncbi:MAG: hypothetical protein Fur0034_02480 [Desulfuromonadia bacterium]